MGKTSGSNQITAAAADPFAGDAKPLAAVATCKKGKTRLTVHLVRFDNGVAVPNETVSASKGWWPTKKTTAGTGAADFGEVDAGSYSFDVTLSTANKSKFKPYTAHTASVPEQVDFHATLKIAPVYRVRIVLFDKAAKATSGAQWTMTSPVAASGTTGANGLIEVEIPWRDTAGKLTVKLPDTGAKEPAPAAAPAPNPNNPAYPLAIDGNHFLPKEEKAKALTDVTLTYDLEHITDADNEDGWKSRLTNLGFPCTNDAPRVTRSVKAFQRLHKNDFAGSGNLSDVSADVKKLHDTT